MHQINIRCRGASPQCNLAPAWRGCCTYNRFTNRFWMITIQPPEKCSYPNANVRSIDGIWSSIPVPLLLTMQIFSSLAPQCFASNDQCWDYINVHLAMWFEAEFCRPYYAHRCAFCDHSWVSWLITFSIWFLSKVQTRSKAIVG